MIATTRSEAETAAVGRALADGLRSGAIVLLQGDLGAGKTVFVRGLAEGLGIDPLEVSSPTFTLIQEYRGGRLALHHVDLYRLAPREVADLGLDQRPRAIAPEVEVIGRGHRDEVVLRDRMSGAFVFPLILRRD